MKDQKKDRKDGNKMIGRFIRQGAALVLAVVVVAFYGLYKSSDRMLQAGGFSGGSQDAENGEQAGYGDEQELPVELVLGTPGEEGSVELPLDAEGAEEGTENRDGQETEEDGEDLPGESGLSAGGAGENSAEADAGSEAAEGMGADAGSGDAEGAEEIPVESISEDGAVISEQTEEIVSQDGSGGAEPPVTMVSEDDDIVYVAVDSGETGALPENSGDSDVSAEVEWTSGDVIAMGEDDLALTEGMEPSGEMSEEADEAELAAAGDDGQQDADTSLASSGEELESADTEELQGEALSGGSPESNTVFFLEEDLQASEEQVGLPEEPGQEEAADGIGGELQDSAALPPVTLNTAAEDGAIITVTAPAGVLPAGARVRASVASGTDMGEAIREASGSGRQVVRAQAYSVVILDAEGNQIEPQGRITVSIRTPSVLEGTENTVYQITSDGAVKQ